MPYLEDDSDLPTFLTARGDAPRPPLKIEWIADGRAGYDASFALINRYGRASAERALGYRAGQTFETVHTFHDEMLEAVPPAGMIGASFVRGEMTTDVLADAFFEIGGRHYCMTIEWSDDYRNLRAARAALIAELERRSIIAPRTGLTGFGV